MIIPKYRNSLATFQIMVVTKPHNLETSLFLRSNILK